MINLFIISFLSIVLTLPLGCLFSKNYNQTIFNYSSKLIYGIIIISFISIFLNFFFPLNKIISSFVILISIIIILKRNNFFFNFIFFKFALIVSIIILLLIVKSNVYRPDAYLYHLPFIDIINKFKIIFGITNLHNRFGHTSILQYTSAIYNNFIFFEKGIFLPSALIASSVIINFGTQLFNYIKKKNLNVHFFYLLFTTIFIAYKMNRYGEYGNDYPAHFLFYYIVSEVISSFKNNRKNFSNLFLISSFVLMNKLSMVFSLILPFLTISKFKKKKILNFKNYFTIIFLLIWIIKNILISGCVFYPIANTCIENLPWTNVNQTKKVSIEIEAWSKSWNNEKNPEYLNQNIYIKNFNWFNTWSKNHLNKIIKILFPYIIFLLLLTLIIILNSKKINEKANIKNEIQLIFIISILTIFWLFKAPLFRFGFSYIVSLISLIFAIIISEYQNYKYKKIYLSLIIFCIFIFVGKNSLRFKNIHSNDKLSIWPIIEIQNSDENLKKIDIGDLKYYESEAECGYGLAPCTHYKNLKISSKNYYSYKAIVNIEKK